MEGIAEDDDDDAAAALSTIPLNIEPDVAIELSTAWQSGIDGTGLDDHAIEFDVHGPSEVVAFLERIKKVIAHRDAIMTSAVLHED